jgi:formyltetrahydrofolate deformylase
MNNAVFLVQCPDRKGLVARISTFFYDRGFNILHCQQYTDVAESRYYMRLKIDLDSSSYALDLLWSVHYSDRLSNVAVLVSKTSHCLYDLLIRHQKGELPCHIPVIISNHPTLEFVAEKFRIPFHCLPVTPTTKAQQETAVLAILKQHHVDLVVLARYMQVLTPKLIDPYAGRIINIHHAFLPAFQGAGPYERAYERGVKMIGATAHYATPELDEGPIIEQDVERVTHEDSVSELRRIGSDIERVVLARAVKAHLEHRVMVTGSRTVVFSSGS